MVCYNKENLYFISAQTPFAGAPQRGGLTLGVPGGSADPVGEGGRTAAGRADRSETEVQPESSGGAPAVTEVQPESSGGVPAAAEVQPE